MHHRFPERKLFTIRFPHVGKLLEEVCYEKPFYGAGGAGIKRAHRRPGVYLDFRRTIWSVVPSLATTLKRVLVGLQADGGESPDHTGGFLRADHAINKPAVLVKGQVLCVAVDLDAEILSGWGRT